MNPIAPKARALVELMRFDRPVGTLLLLWPTLWALWFAAGGAPPWRLLIIFVLGVVLMRAAGCVINDYADRAIDGRVERTRQRPIADGRVHPTTALWLFAGLCVMAFLLVLLTNRLTVLLSLGAVAIAALYPFTKRYTHLPQAVLGAAWAWSIPMAFAAQTGSVPRAAWALYAGVVLWTIAFDTFYAMVDRDDDLKIGIKSTAILFADQDLVAIALLQGLTLFALAIVGQNFARGGWYFAGVVAAAMLFFYQQLRTRRRDRAACMAAFRNNNWVGAAVFAGIALDYQWPL